MKERKFVNFHDAGWYLFVMPPTRMYQLKILHSVANIIFIV